MPKCLLGGKWLAQVKTCKGAHQHLHGEGSHGSVLKPLPLPGFICQYGCKAANHEYQFWAEGRTVGHCNHSELVLMFKGLLKNILGFYDMCFCVPGKSSFKVHIWIWFQNDADTMPECAILKKTESLIEQLKDLSFFFLFWVSGLKDRGTEN